MSLGPNLEMKLNWFPDSFEEGLLSRINELLVPLPSTGYLTNKIKQPKGEENGYRPFHGRSY